MDAFEDRLRARMDALETAAPVVRPRQAGRVSRRLSARWIVAAGVAAALVLATGVATFAPQATEAATRTYALSDDVTVTARTHATWTGTVDLATAEKTIVDTFGSKLDGAKLAVTASWQLAATLEVKGHEWSMTWNGPNAKPVDVWVVEWAGTAAEGWPMTLDGVVDAHTGAMLGGGLSQQVPQSLQGDPNKATPDK